MHKSVFCAKRINYNSVHNTFRLFTKKSSEKQLQECYKTLNIPQNSTQEVVRQAFLELAKQYHPDSGSPDANIETFVAIESAFRTLTKLNTGQTATKDVEKIVYDITHTAPQHRQYLSFEGVGYGTPFQRQKQYTQARAQKAASNVMEHRISKALASDKALMKKGQYANKHDIKTKYGFDRLVEDLIQESMSKGEFDNLSGKGKPLRDQNRNPYVDFTTHKLNEVLINNGFTPEWITLSKEIDLDIDQLKEVIKTERQYLGPYPLNEKDAEKWKQMCEINSDLAKSINMKINKYNLIVPLINKQKFLVEFEKMSDDILTNGKHSVMRMERMVVEENEKYTQHSYLEEDIFSIFFKAVGEFLTFNNKHKSKKIDNK